VTPDVTDGIVLNLIGVAAAHTGADRVLHLKQVREG